MTNKEIAIQRLQATIDKIGTLKPHEFNYASFVEEYDEKNECGTTCCVAGWYPKWFPESGIKWRNDNGNITPDTDKGLHISLSDYHYLSRRIIDGLFYGFNFNILPNISDGCSMEDATIEDVKQRFDYILGLLQTTDELDSYIL